MMISDAAKGTTLGGATNYLQIKLCDYFFLIIYLSPAVSVVNSIFVLATPIPAPLMAATVTLYVMPSSTVKSIMNCASNGIG